MTRKACDCVAHERARPCLHVHLQARASLYACLPMEHKTPFAPNPLQCKHTARGAKDSLKGAPNGAQCPTGSKCHALGKIGQFRSHTTTHMWHGTEHIVEKAMAAEFAPTRTCAVPCVRMRPLRAHACDGRPPLPPWGPPTTTQPPPPSRAPVSWCAPLAPAHLISAPFLSSCSFSALHACVDSSSSACSSRVVGVGGARRRMSRRSRGGCVHGACTKVSHHASSARAPSRCLVWTEGLRLQKGHARAC